MKRLLPDLKKNIVCGNSLVGPDIFDSYEFERKRELALNAMDFAKAFPTVMERGGFDAVLGNPPYVLLQGEFRDDDLLGYFRAHYSVAAYKVDTYHLFIERGVALTKAGGRCSMITPANFLTNKYLAALRGYLLEKSAIDHVLVIDGGVFSGVSVDNAIFVVEPGRPTTDPFTVAHYAQGKSGLGETSRVTLSPAKILEHRDTLFTGQIGGLTPLWERIQEESVPLAALAYVNFGKQLRDRELFPKDVIRVDSLSDIPRGYRPCYTGRDISRYGLTWGNLACRNSHVARRGGCWDATRQDAKFKLLTRQIGRCPAFALDPDGYQCLNTAFMVNAYAARCEPRYLLGVLNSRLLRRFWADQFCDQRQTFPKIKGGFLEQLPVHKLDLEEPADRELQSAIVSKVDALLTAMHQLAEARTDRDKDYYGRKSASFDQQIDALIYKVYGLTDEEIGAVEKVD